MSLSRSVTSCDATLIVGAGPTGLIIGIELLSQGLPCRLVDKRLRPADNSRAFTVQPRSAELLNLRNLLAPFLDVGKKHRGMAIFFRGVETAEYIDFTELDTPNPYILIVEQQDTEAILREAFERLGGTIEWGTELESITTDPDGRITAVLHHQNARRSGREVTTPGWVVGCDGVNSTVRTLSGFGFDGISYTGTRFRMMDVYMRNPPQGCSEWIEYRVDPEEMLLITELPSAYRGLISDKRDAPRANAHPDPIATRAAFQRVVSSWLPDTVLGELKWCTEFDIMARRANAFRRGRALLVGDSAHVYPPTGGVGMNTCIQAAFNLGWKLAAVLGGRAPESLLDTYEAERLPIADQVGEATDMLRAIMFHGHSIEARLRIMREPDFHSKAAELIAGLGFHYRDVIAQPGLTPLAGLTAGDRAPNTPITSTRGVHDLLAHPDYTLMVLQARPHSTVADDVAKAVAPFHDLMRTEVIAPPEAGANAPAGAHVADNPGIFDRYGHHDKDTLVLTRPDGHIGFRCGADELATAIATFKDAVLT
ncbi:FAD-dependent monooxygenase [Nocardia sp. CA-107356]|uniref:FAD-dependent monooxygenase n=1 Tax=Nocardia sp. CA-107356 TaxID=3239972 RepID=UPI003D8DE63C